MMDHQLCRRNQPRRRVALLLRKDHQLTKMAAFRVTARKAPIVGLVGVMETAKRQSRFAVSITAVGID